MANPNEEQVAGRHYQSEFQHWDFVQECLGGCYMEGNITKYVARWRAKNGVEDLLKAYHYWQKLRQMFLDNIVDCGPGCVTMGRVMEFCTINNLNHAEQAVMRIAATWENLADLEELGATIQDLIGWATTMKSYPNM